MAAAQHYEETKWLFLKYNFCIILKHHTFDTFFNLILIIDET